MYSHSTEAAKPLPCSVPLAVVLYGAGNHQPVVSRKVTFACDELEDFTDESYVEKERRNARQCRSVIHMSATSPF